MGSYHIYYFSKASETPLGVSQQGRWLCLPQSFRQTFRKISGVIQGLDNQKNMVSDFSDLARLLTDFEKLLFYSENIKLFAVFQDYQWWNSMTQTWAYFLI